MPPPAVPLARRSGNRRSQNTASGSGPDQTYTRIHRRRIRRAHQTQDGRNSAVDAAVTRSPNQAAVLSESEIAATEEDSRSRSQGGCPVGCPLGIHRCRSPGTGGQSLIRLLSKSGAIRPTHLLQLQPQCRDRCPHERHGRAGSFSNEGYLPAEGPQEVQRGIELARADARLAGKVQALQGHGLLMQPDRGFFKNDPGYEHRVIWITFSQGQDGDPKVLGSGGPDGRPRAGRRG